MEEIKKLIIFEPEPSAAKTLENWLKELNLDFVIEGELKKLEAALLKEKFDCLLLSLHQGIDSSLCVDPAIESALALLRTLKTSAPTRQTTAILITSQKAAKIIASAINAGVDNVLTEGANKDQFLKGLKELLSRPGQASVKKRLVNLNLINYLIQLCGYASREDFFLLVSTILNQLLLANLKPVVGGPVLEAIITRLKDTFGQQYPYLQQIKYSEGHISLEAVDSASKTVEVRLLSFAFRDYIYAFMHLMRILTSDILIERWDQERK
ncbi:MAG: hypothetical protein AABZ65_07275 [Candidatus Omnitrophota bacterium]